MQFKLSNPIRESFRVSDRDHTQRRTVSARSSQPTTITVDPAVWATALKLADGDALRIEVLSATDVVVRNGRSRRLTAYTQRRNVVP